MMDDMRATLDAELDTVSTPTAITAVQIIHKGRKRAAARAGGLVTGVVVLLAGAVFLNAGNGIGGPSAAGGDGGDPSPSWTESNRPIDFPAYLLPDLPPDDYVWYPRTEAVPKTPETEALTEAWWQMLAGTRGTQLVDDDNKPITRDAFPDIVRTGEELYVEDHTTRLAERMTYIGTTYARFGDATRLDKLTVALYPKGTFEYDPTVGHRENYSAGWRNLPPNCLRLNVTSPLILVISCSSDTFDGPEGAGVTTIDLTGKGLGDEPVARANRTLVVLPDGNAIMFTDLVTSQFDAHGQPIDLAPEPGFSAAELTAMALSFPSTVVE